MIELDNIPVAFVGKYSLGLGHSIQIDKYNNVFLTQENGGIRVNDIRPRRGEIQQTRFIDGEWETVEAEDFEAIPDRPHIWPDVPERTVQAAAVEHWNRYEVYTPPRPEPTYRPEHWSRQLLAQARPTVRPRPVGLFDLDEDRNPEDGE